MGKVASPDLGALGAEGSRHRRLLDRIRGVQLELSLVPLYDGETLFLSQVDCLARKGFELWDLMPSFVDKETGQTLQVDGIFFRPDACSNGERVPEEIEG